MLNNTNPFYFIVLFFLLIFFFFFRFLQTVYVPLDLSQLSYGAEDASKQLSSQAKLQMVDLHSDRPMFRLGEALYEGSWQDMVGTELYSTFGK